MDVRLDAVESENWGVLACELDMPALDGGMVAVREFAGVLPDGTPVAFDSTTRDAPASRPVEGHLASHQAVLEVFVGIARSHEARNNVGVSKGALTRYFAATDLTHDRYGEAPPQDVDVACVNLRLLFGDEAREDYSAVKVAEIQRAADGRLVLSDDYIVPCRRVSASPALSRLLDTLLTSMNARRTALLETVRQRGDSTVEFTAADVTRYLLLATINSYLPVLRHIVVTGDMSAKATYLLLCQLAGQLSTFTTQFDPNDVPRFIYRGFEVDLRDDFQCARTDSCKATLVPSATSLSQLKSRGDAMHIGEIGKTTGFSNAAQFVLGVQLVGRRRARFASVLPRVAKLASVERHQFACSRRRPRRASSCRPQ